MTTSQQQITALRATITSALDVLAATITAEETPVVVPPPPARSGIGFYPGYDNVSNLLAHEKWLGKPVTHVVQFGDAKSAAAFESSVWGYTVNPAAHLPLLKDRITLVLSVPLAFGAATGVSACAVQLGDTLHGLNDGAYQRAAGYVRTAGFKNVIIRLAWEHDGRPGWMPWASDGNVSLFQDAYRRVHGIFASRLTDCRFDYCGTLNNLTQHMAAYPGDDVVDIIGMDVYDKGGLQILDLVAQQSILQQFATRHLKPVSYPEWGLTSAGSTGGGGDDPMFVRTVLGRSTLYQAYFDEDAGDGQHRLQGFPSSALQYKALA